MKRWLVGSVSLVAVVALAGWIFRADIQARYYAHKLLAADDNDKGAWIEQAGAWGDRVPDRLLVVLSEDDPDACGRAAAALERLRMPAIVGLLADRFGRFSTTGQLATLEHSAAFASEQPDVLAAGRQIVRAALQNSDAGVRLRGAALALRPEIGITDLLVPLLKDSSAEVRRAAIVAVGPSRDLIADDDLLCWLHDSDAEVRRLTEAALRSRGLRAADVRLGRLLTDPRPAARLELMICLANDTELDISPWLKRLSDDPSAAVRAAAARMADECRVFQLTDRLVEMSKSDPDMTIRQTVAFHLGHLRSEVRSVSAP